MLIEKVHVVAEGDKDLYLVGKRSDAGQLPTTNYNTHN